MEMLNGISIAFVTVILTSVIGLLAWIATSVVDLKTDTAVIAVKVNENHKMITTLWEDYINRSGNGNLAQLNSSTDIKTAIE
jgi:hypothetical protein